IPRAFGYRLAIEGVPAASADREALQQVPLSTRVALREVFVALQLGLCRFEQFARDDRGHVDVDPLLGRSIAMRRFRMPRYGALAADRTKKSSPLRRFRFSESCFAHLRRIAENGPHRCAIPACSSAASRYALDVERTHDLADRFLLADERIED